MNHNMVRVRLIAKIRVRSPCVILFPMSASGVKATVRLVSDDLFVGITPSGHSITLDTDHSRSIAPSPTELLLLAVGACTATDVASILEKKRQQVTGYVVEVSGVRREDYPRKYTSMKVHHILTGRNLSPNAVAKAIELSDTKYCSVAATLRPGVEIQTSFEIIEDTADPTRGEIA
jgi:putative redox protein